MQTVESIINIPLHQLRLSPNNSRKHRSAAHIASTLESLKAHGQLHNLLVTPAGDGQYNVDAGGTRLLAYQLGVERGEIAADHPVRCLPVDAGLALEVSTAENTIREDMHPADQFRAFHALIEQGKSTTDVAAHFSVTEAVVAQRLKLANVAPDLFALYEQGAMQLNQLQALALTDDQDAQRRAWFGQKGAKVEHDWQRRPENIRERITSREVGPSNPLVRYVGADAYAAAGGQVRRDMFSDDVYFADAKLLERLAAEKLEVVAAREREAGWSWVEAHLSLDYSEHNRYGRGPYESKARAFTAAENARASEIKARMEAIEKAQQSDDEDADIDWDQLEAEGLALKGELDDLKGQREQWSSDAKAKTGVLIHVDRHYGLRIERGRLKPDQRMSAGKLQGGKQSGPKKPTLSADMLDRLERQRTAAIRLHLADHPDDALVLLLLQLSNAFARQVSNALSISPTNEHRADDTAIRAKFSELAKAPARIQLEERAARAEKAMPTGRADRLAWLYKRTPAERLELLALLVAVTVPVRQGDGKAAADAYGINMADWWQPTGETYVSLVPKPLLAEAVADVAGKAAGEALLGKKKDAAMAEAAQVLAGTGWLPKPLRGAGYTLAKDAAAAPAPAAGKKPAGKGKPPAKPTTAAKTTSKPPKAPAAKTTPKPAKKAATKARKAGAK